MQDDVQKLTKAKEKAMNVTHMVECLLSKSEALSSNQNTTKNV
jgi:hypothetical protein